MGLTRVRLGDFIEVSTANNSDERYGSELIRGVTNAGTIAMPKGNVSEVDLKPYKIVRGGAFVYNPSRLNLGSFAYYPTGMCIVSHLYIVFYLNELGRQCIDPMWLYMYIRRSEFYREVTFRNFGSQRPEFNFKKLSEIELPLPPIDVQRRYVAIYESMLANQRAYESVLDDLKLTLDASLDCCKHTSQTVSLGDLLKETDVRNAEGRAEMPMGLTLSQDFQPSKANLNNPFNYKIVEDGYIAANLIQIGRDAAYPIALNETGHALLVSPDYKVFEPLNREIARFLTAWFGRAETGRFGWFICDDGVRGRLNVDKFLELRVPIPDEKWLHAVADLWSAYGKRRSINNRLKAQLKDVCPILIRGSIEEASR